MKQGFLLILIGLMVIFIGAACAPAQAATNANYGTLSVATATLSDTFKPQPGTFSISIVPSGDAAGSFYLERTNPTLGITGWQKCKTFSGQTETYWFHSGDTGWQYRIRAALTAGTAYVLLAQGSTDTNKTSTF